MSKLAQMIQAAQTNERRHVMTPLARFDVHVSDVRTSQISPVHYVYKIEATFGCNAVIESDGKAVEQKLKAVRRQVVEDILGEFRQDIYAIERALFDRDTDAALQEVGKLLKHMYEV